MQLTIYDRKKKKKKKKKNVFSRNLNIWYQRYIFQSNLAYYNYLVFLTANY